MSQRAGGSAVDFPAVADGEEMDFVPSDIEGVNDAIVADAETVAVAAGHAVAFQAVKDICLKGVSEHANFTIPSKPSWTKKMADNGGVGQLKKLTDCIGGVEVANANEQFEERKMGREATASANVPI